MRVLITGVSGFVGRHLSQYLITAGTDTEIHGTVIESPPTTFDAPVTFYQLDLRDSQSVSRVMGQARPDHIYHLAAQSSPRESLSDPWGTIENNVRAQLNILEAALVQQIKPRILIISSAEIYAATENAINEDTPFLPTTPYAVSKITQDMLGLQYSKWLPIMRVRPFNHTGPGQREDFVAPAFAMQIARIEAGLQEPVIHVRNLLAQIDFTDVRDVVRAYFLILERGASGEVYNIASGKPCTVQSLLNMLLNLSSLTTRPEIKCTGSQVPTIKIGDASRLSHATGWNPQIPFEQTLLDLLNDCRHRVQNSQIAD